MFVDQPGAGQWGFGNSILTKLRRHIEQRANYSLHRH